MIKVNSDESYLGKDIREWCMNKTEDSNAIEIREKYYSDEVKFKPSDKVYYFVDYISASQSYKECGSLNMYGYRLTRDLDKSPRKPKLKKENLTFFQWLNIYELMVKKKFKDLPKYKQDNYKREFEMFKAGISQYNR